MQDEGLSMAVRKCLCRLVPSHSRRMASTVAAARRVVVTGMGLVTPLGIGVDHVWQRILNGESGITALTAPEYAKLPARIGGVIPRGNGPGELDLDSYVSKSQQRAMDLSTCYTQVGAHEALEQAKWKPQTEEQRCRTGVAVGMGMSTLNTVLETGKALERGYSKVSPYFVPKVLVNMPAANISLKYGFKGVNHAVSTACTTGVHAVGDAYRFIKYGDADIMVCGSTEGCLTPLTVAGFSRLRALSASHNDNPTAASRPFDKDRDGFVMSEGAGIVVLETLEHAKARDAKIFAEILGYGLSADSSHLTAPSEDGDGAFRCMKNAVKDAGLQIQDVTYINAHATSTPLGDAAESRAILRLFGEATSELKVSSTKGAVGHLLGGAGSVEAIFTIMACHTGTVPPTANCYNPEPEFSLDYVPLKSVPWNKERRVALTNSFGFGGTNASLVISSFS